MSVTIPAETLQTLMEAATQTRDTRRQWADSVEHGHLRAAIGCNASRITDALVIGLEALRNANRTASGGAITIPKDQADKTWTFLSKIAVLLQTNGETDLAREALELTAALDPRPDDEESEENQ